MKPFPPVSEAELDILTIIWAAGGTALYAEIMAALAQQQRPWKKNTVLTLLSRLVEKGALATSKQGRRNAYTALFSAGDFQASQTRSFVDKVYSGDGRHLVSTLIEQDILSADDLAELNRFWQEGRHE